MLTSTGSLVMVQAESVRVLRGIKEEVKSLVIKACSIEYDTADNSRSHMKHTWQKQWRLFFTKVS